MPDSMKARERRDELGETSEIIPDKEWRCPYCHKLLFKGQFGRGSAISVKCTQSKCRRMITFNIL